MKKIKAFFYILFKSLTSLEYYKDVLVTRIGFSLKYFLLLSFLFSLIFSVRTALMGAPVIKETISKVVDSAIATYPQDFEFEVKKGEWSINQPEPFGIKFPEINAEVADQKGIPTYIVVSDKTGTINSLETFNTLVLINKTNVLTRGSNGKIEAYPLTEVLSRDFKVTNIEFERLMLQLKEMSKIVLPIFYIGETLFWLFVVFTLGFVYLLAVSVLLSLIGIFASFDFSFKQTMQVAIHTFTLPLVLFAGGLVSALIFKVPNWILWLFLIGLGYGVVALSYITKEKKVLKPTPEQTPPAPQV